MKWFDLQTAVQSCLCPFLLAAALTVPSAHAQSHPNIATWGVNLSSWNQALHLTALREGCSVYPSECEPYLDNIANDAGATTYYVSFPLSLSNSASWAKEWSTVSLSHKMVIEIDLDDFIGQLEDLQVANELSNPAAFVSSVIAATKSVNPNLGFGATIYEDQLTHTMLTTTLTASIRAQFQYVHLYVHYRENAPNFASYVATAKSLFPKAQIIAGAYPYDRIDYLPCAFKGTVKCTAAQEQSLFQELLQIQSNMVQAGTVHGLEFYFGYFGDPQDWSEWTTQSNACLPARLSQCYANTSVLQNIAKEVIASTFFSTSSSGSSSSGSGSPAVTLSYNSIYMGTKSVGQTSGPAYLVLNNTGTGTLSLSSISASGDFLYTNDNCGSTVAAHGACTITVYFKPSGTGTRTGSIVYKDNAGSGTQTVPLSGTGVN
jgi:hypothetical protein